MKKLIAPLPTYQKGQRWTWFELEAAEEQKQWSEGERVQELNNEFIISNYGPLTADGWLQIHPWKKKDADEK